MVKIRLARGGAKKKPFYHIVVADSEAWSRLAAAARERVERLVRDQGLGLLLLTDNVSGAAREALPELAPGLAEAPPRSDRRTSGKERLKCCNGTGR